MKNAATYEKRFKGFLAQLRKAYSPAAPTLPTDPTVELIWSVVLEDAPEGTAKVALSRLTGQFVDFNELRVSRVDEIANGLPNTLSDARGRAGRMTVILQAIFDKFNTLVIPELRDLGKRDARHFIGSIPQMTPFVEARACLFAAGIHAVPVDRTLAGLLADHGIVQPEADLREIQGFLERVVPAKEAVEIALLLEAFRQEPAKMGAGKFKVKAKAAPPPPAAEKPTPAKPASAPAAEKPKPAKPAPAPEKPAAKPAAPAAAPAKKSAPARKPAGKKK